MNNIAAVIPDVVPALQAVSKLSYKGGISPTTIGLVELRASQINGCSVCVDMHCYYLKQKGETDQRLFALSAWRHAPYFTEAERAALALTEAVTLISEHPDGVSDNVWEEATKHYDEKGIAALLIAISSINVWNRLNISTRQIAGYRPEPAEQATW
jgi:AhpD family alkylhydroperoxidase